MTFYDIKFDKPSQMFKIGYYDHRAYMPSLFVEMAEATTLNGAYVERDRLTQAEKDRNKSATRAIGWLDRRRYRGQV